MDVIMQMKCKLACYNVALFINYNMGLIGFKEHSIMKWIKK